MLHIHEILIRIKAHIGFNLFLNDDICIRCVVLPHFSLFLSVGELGDANIVAADAGVAAAAAGVLVIKKGTCSYLWLQRIRWTCIQNERYC